MLLAPGRYRVDGFTVTGRIAADPVTIAVH
jgi:hypothetical protein